MSDVIRIGSGQLSNIISMLRATKDDAALAIDILWEAKSFRFTRYLVPDVRAALFHASNTHFQFPSSFGGYQDLTYEEIDELSNYMDKIRSLLTKLDIYDYRREVKSERPHPNRVGKHDRHKHH